MANYYLYIPATAYFHGEDNSLIFNNTTGLLPSCTGTFSIWVKPLTTVGIVGEYTLLTIRTTTGVNEGRVRLTFDAANTISVFYDFPAYAGSTIATSSSTYDLDEWRCICWTVGSNGVLRLYVDDKYEGMGQVLSPLGTPSIDLMYAGDETKNICVDSFSVYEGTVLTEQQITKIYNYGDGTLITEDGFEGISSSGYYCPVNSGTGNQVAGRSISDGVWADAYGPVFDNSIIIWQAGGVADEFLGKNAQIYYTSLEPDLAQTNPLQSIGGYVSTSLVYPEARLLNDVGFYDNLLEIDVVDDLQIWQGIEYVSINKEIIKVRPITSNQITVLNRGVNNILNVHIENDMAKGIKPYKLFNNSLNEDHKQYRCIAAKNTSLMTKAYRTSVYVSQNPFNSGVKIKIAVETPKTQFTTGTSTSWNSTTLVDTSFIGQYDSDAFKNAYMKILSGPNENRGKIISSFNSSTGTFVFQEAFPIDFVYNDNGTALYSNSVDFEIEPSPAQRLRTGMESPSSGVIDGRNIVTGFYETSESNRLFINFTFSPNDIFYIWIERTIAKGSILYPNDNIYVELSFYSE